MEAILKCAAAAVISAIMALIIKRNNPELALALAAAAVCVILITALKLSSGIAELFNTAELFIPKAKISLAPLLKCVGIACVTKIGADICRDSAQSAAASSLELAGTLCAAAVSAPMVISMLKLIGDMI